MKILAILTLLLCSFQNGFSQQQKSDYSFQFEIHGQGQPIILIPGLVSSGEVWNQTVDSLQSNYECHILTLPGFSTKKAISLENGFLPVIKTEIIKYINNELDEKPIIVGHSLGGFLSLSIASTEPQLLSKIVIVDSYPFYSLIYNPAATEENMVKQAESMRKYTLATTEEAFSQQQKAFMPSMITDPAKAEIAARWSIESDRQTSAQAMYELMTTDLRKDIDKVNIPILVLGSWYGAKDYGITKQIVKSTYESQFLNASNCTIEIADTAKHFIMWDEPRWFLNTVKNFLDNEQ